IGAARIARQAVIDPAKSRDDAIVAVVAARDPARAEAYAQKFGVGRVASDYEALIADPEIDAVYIALPPSHHIEVTLAALAAGKPVLLEKHFAMNAADARTMVEAGRRHGVLLMEAFHYRYHPMIARVLE